MTSGHAVVQTFVSLINSNITNPNPDIGTGSYTWVFDTIGKNDMGRVYPRINVINTTSNCEPHEVGSTNERLKPRIEVQIRVRKGSQFTISEVSKNDIETLDYVSKQVTDLIKTTSSLDTLRTNDSVFHAVLETENTTYGDIVLIRQLVYKTILKR